MAGPVVVAPVAIDRQDSLRELLTNALTDMWFDGFWIGVTVGCLVSLLLLTTAWPRKESRVPEPEEAL